MDKFKSPFFKITKAKIVFGLICLGWWVKTGLDKEYNLKIGEIIVGGVLIVIATYVMVGLIEHFLYLRRENINSPFWGLSKFKIISFLVLSGLWLNVLIKENGLLQKSGREIFISMLAVALVGGLLVLFLIGPIEALITWRRKIPKETGEVLLAWRANLYRGLSWDGKIKVLTTLILPIFLHPALAIYTVLVAPIFFYPFRWRVRTTGIGIWRSVPWSKIKQYAIGKRLLALYDENGRQLLRVPFYVVEPLEAMVSQHAVKITPKSKWGGIFEIE